LRINIRVYPLGSGGTPKRRQYLKLGAEWSET